MRAQGTRAILGLMDFPSPFARGVLVSRYKRFFANVVLNDGTEVTAHCPNPGTMLGLNTTGLPAYISRSDNPKRKFVHTLELVKVDGGLVGINTMHPNRLVVEAWRRTPSLSSSVTQRTVARSARGWNPAWISCWSTPTAGPAGWRSRSATDAAPERSPSSATAWPPAHSNICANSRHGRQGPSGRHVVHPSAHGFRRFHRLSRPGPGLCFGPDQSRRRGVEVLSYACEITLARVKVAARLPWLG